MLRFMTLSSLEGLPLRGKDFPLTREGRSLRVDRMVDLGMLVRREISQVGMLARCIPSIIERL